jgi:hypothetical protein
MRVFVVMSNDYPDAVYINEGAADSYAKRKNDEDKAEYPHRRIFWRVHPFELKTPDENSEVDTPFTPENLDVMSRDVEAMRAAWLFGVDEAGADPAAEQQYLMALSFLEIASRYMRLAQFAQSKALATIRH